MEDFEKWRRFKRMARNMAARIVSTPYDLMNVDRASGNAICDDCGLDYNDHPEVEHLVVRTCDNRLWKL